MLKMKYTAKLFTKTGPIKSGHFPKLIALKLQKYPVQIFSFCKIEIYLNILIMMTFLTGFFYIFDAKVIAGTMKSTLAVWWI